MYVFEVTWIHLDLHEFVRICKDLRGFVKICLDLSRFARICVNLSRFVWICMDLLGFVIALALLDSPRVRRAKPLNDIGIFLSLSTHSCKEPGDPAH